MPGAWGADDAERAGEPGAENLRDRVAAAPDRRATQADPGAETLLTHIRETRAQVEQARHQARQTVQRAERLHAAALAQAQVVQNLTAPRSLR
ncbi:hypothetical protein [Actinomadura sp. 21ATH]|uniref:hypothetical protein n=1 Tax=Actinomadura sp. 21ATH TaxID=1735444 RepID=UPI0035C0E5A0